MIPLSTAVIVVPNDLIADPSNKKNGTQKLGKQMGNFMNSFMEGLDDQDSAKPAGKLKPKGLAQKRGLNSRQNSYDPWGARTNRNNNKAHRYDPWGATRDSRGLTRFADQDWALGKRYYDVGIEPEQNQRGYRSYPDPYYGQGYPNQRRYYEPSWPGSSYGNPYDRNRYNGSDWRR